ncbi:MAG: hypothetical protein IPK68_20600 [Bdellovibrionales bacterium]|nr:hypothetical protein [Bdellovibrionales bacterium]
MKLVNKVAVVLASAGLFWCQEVLALKRCLQELEIVGQADFFQFPNSFPVTDDKDADPNTYTQARGLLNNDDPLRGHSYSGFLYQGFLICIFQFRSFFFWKLIILNHP